MFLIRIRQFCVCSARSDVHELAEARHRHAMPCHAHAMPRLRLLSARLARQIFDLPTSKTRNRRSMGGCRDDVLQAVWTTLRVSRASDSPAYCHCQLLRDKSDALWQGRAGARKWKGRGGTCPVRSCDGLCDVDRMARDGVPAVRRAFPFAPTTTTTTRLWLKGRIDDRQSRRSLA